jgi:hypothetical protein
VTHSFLSPQLRLKSRKMVENVSKCEVGAGGRTVSIHHYILETTLSLHGVDGTTP